jgi:SagB-type dehydrogenase family enzyme
VRPHDDFPGGVAATRVRFRRSPFVVLYWRGTRLLAHEYARGHVAEISTAVAAALHACTKWQTIAGLERELGVSLPRARDYARVLLSHGFVRLAGAKQDPRDRAMASLDAWNPSAGLFHDVSRRVTFLTPAAAAAFTRRRARESPMPPAVKRLRRTAVVPLPKPQTEGEFPNVLRSRRTWRRFGAAPVPIEDVATALGLTAGVQQWVPTELGRVPLKTSPSGGARHPIEVYICARRIAGLEPGLYHYASDIHALECLRRGDLTRRLPQWMPHSQSLAQAAFIVIFTAVMERETWRYRYARAYRAVIAEAGHVCQTFCLTATWLGLAPFCLMGLDDASIEHDLGLDGVRETVLYAAGAGTRPHGASWAPRRKGTLDSVPNRAFTDL